MTAREVLEHLERCGTAQNRTVYARHGVKNATFGVSLANLDAIRKRIKVDQKLAVELWKTGNHDAQVLATKIADPDLLSKEALAQWSNDLGNYIIADAMAGLAARTPHGKATAAKWTRSRNEWICRAGWMTLSHLAMNNADLPDSFFQAYLTAVEQSIHSAKNYTRHAMNNALIAIGIRSPELTKEALDIAERIGKVGVDHGETGCKTPDAAAYIRKTLEYRRRRRASRAVR